MRLAALALLWTLTYRNAWGQIFPTENLLVLHVIARRAYRRLRSR